MAASNSFATKLPKRPHLVKPTGGVAGEVAKLRADMTPFANYLGAYTNSGRNDLENVETGMWIFNTSDGAPNFFNGTDWVDSMGNIT